MMNDMAKAFAEGVKAALQVFTLTKTPPAAAQDVIKALESAANSTTKPGR